MIVDDGKTISAGIARSADQNQAMQDQAKKGLIDFLRQQITDAEWQIARSKAEIDAYKKAIEAIERQGTSHAA